MAAFRALKSGVMSWCLSVLLVLEFSLICNALLYQRGPPRPCVKIENKICQGNYNYTVFPNILGHEDHEEATRRFEEFVPLIDNECSSQVKFFLCSLHFPMCVSQVIYGIPACREMCEEVRQKCEPFLTTIGLDWPETIRCDRLPRRSMKRCMYPSQPDDDQVVAAKHEPNTDDVNIIEEVDDVILEEPARPNRRQKQNKRKKDRKAKERNQEKTIFSKTEIMGDSPDVDTNTILNVDDDVIIGEENNHKIPETAFEDKAEEQGKLPKWSPVDVANGPIFPEVDPDYTGQRYAEYESNYESDSSQFIEDEEHKPAYLCKNPDKFLYVERLNKCLPICDSGIDVMFSSLDKKFAYYWMLACSILCIVSSALTVGTFMVDSKRFRYPERPIIFLSLCYLLYSSAYLVRLGRGPDGSVSCVTEEDSDVSHVVMGDLESTGCTAVFFLLYYFGMAAAVWWVILSITWFLAAGLKWGHEAIEAHGFYFHLVAWLLPAIQTVVVLVMGRVDGDELTGLCYVGNLDTESLLYFVIVPLAVYLAVGALALGSGFLSLFKIRRVILRKSGEKDAGKLEKLMLKIGIFTVLYIVPTACVVAVNVYQYKNQSTWMEKAAARPCYPPGYHNDPTIPYKRFSRNAPEIPLKYPLYRDPPYFTYQGMVYPYAHFVPSSYDSGTFVIPDDTYTGFGQPRYPIEYPPPQYPYKPGSSYQPDLSNPQQEGESDSSLYNGKRLYLVPASSISDYPLRPYHKSKAPLGYNERMALMKNRPDIKKQTSESNTQNMDQDCHLADSIPSFPIFAIKIFMSLLAGITSGIWVWSGKTYKSWSIFCKTSWCGKKNKEKGSVASSNTPHATSIGNIQAPPSVTSQLLPKVNTRTQPDGELPASDGNRYSYPVLSDKYQGYHSVMQEDNYKQVNDVTTYTSSANMQRPGGLTLGDIAREYSDNPDSDREIGGNRNNRRNGTYIVSQCNDNEVTKDVLKKNKSWFKNNANKMAQIHTPRDSFVSKSNRAIPNVYEDAPSNQGRSNNYNKQSNRNIDGAFSTPNGYKSDRNTPNRVRKYSENDMNKLHHVSQSGFSPMSTSTRKKAESVHIGTMTCI